MTNTALIEGGRLRQLDKIKSVIKAAAFAKKHCTNSESYLVTWFTASQKFSAGVGSGSRLVTSQEALYFVRNRRRLPERVKRRVMTLIHPIGLVVWRCYSWWRWQFTLRKYAAADKKLVQEKADTLKLVRVQRGQSNWHSTKRF